MSDTDLFPVWLASRRAFAVVTTSADYQYAVREVAADQSAPARSRDVVGPVGRMRPSPGGDRLAVSSLIDAGATTRVFSLTDDRPPIDLPSVEQAYECGADRSIALHARSLTGTSDDSESVVDWSLIDANGGVVRELERTTAAARVDTRSAAVYCDGDRFGVAIAGTLVVYDRASGRELFRRAFPDVGVFVVGPDGHWLHVLGGPSGWDRLPLPVDAGSTTL